MEKFRGCKAMKKTLSSTIQVFRQIKSDPMMFAACFTPFIMGALIKFGIPFLERITEFSLQGYYIALFCICHDYVRGN